MMLTSKAAETVTLSLIRARLESDKVYRKNVSTLVGMLDGIQLEPLEKKLNEQYSDAEDVKDFMASPGAVNMISAMLDKTCRAYKGKGGTKREIHRNGKRDDAATDAWTVFMRSPEVAWGPTWKRAYRLTKLVRTVALKPTARTDGPWGLDLFTPDQFGYATHPKLKSFPIAFWYEIPSDDPKNPGKALQGWTHEGIYEMSVAQRKAMSGGGDEFTAAYEMFDPESAHKYRVDDNKYGEIPVYFLRLDPSSRRLCPSIDETIAEWQNSVNVGLTELNQITKRQAMSLAVVKGKEGDIDVGAGAVLNLPPDNGDGTTSFSWETPSPMIAEVVEVLKQKINLQLQAKGINPEAFWGTNGIASGLSLMIRDQDMLELREDDQEWLYDEEANLAALVIRMAQKETAVEPSLKAINPGDELVVKFPPYRPPADRTDEYHLQREMVEDGIMSIFDLYKFTQDVEDVPDNEVKAALEKIKTENAENPLGGAPPTGPASGGFNLPGL